ncbi:MAG: NTP transferase domain-containing protein [Nanoarchaeota archaeon]|nr:NTP transferase domain-containing protein [Nanoarchaeota archaeon]
MKAVIMVGGEGKRMGYRVKSLLKKDGKTLLEYIIEILRGKGVDEIILNVANKKDFDKFNFKKVRTLEELDIKEDYLLLVGDSIIDFDLEEIKKKGGEIVALTQEFEIPYGVIEEGIFKEKPKKEICIGVFLIRGKKIVGNSIPLMMKKYQFSTCIHNEEFVHLTTKEDYHKWVNLKEEIK